MIVQSLDELAARHRLDADRDGLDARRAAGAAFHDALTQSILSQRVRQPLMTESLPGQYWLADLYPIPGSPLDAMIRETEALVLVREKRIRARKTIDQETYTQVIRVIMTNLVFIGMTKPGGRIIISLDKSKKYTAWPMKTFRKAITALAEAGFVNLDKGRHHQLASSLSTTERLMVAIAEAGVTLEDISKRPVSDLILRRGKEEIAFEETDQTIAIRRRLACINEALADAPVWFNAPWAKLLYPDLMKGVHDDRMRLHRVFHDDWTKHGRLYGGWWMNMKKSLRPFIQIGNETTAYIDWSSMHVRLAYSMMNRKAPEGDLYDLSSHLPGYQKWKHRDAVKTIMNANGAI